jgi:hypothetical protein
MTSTKRILGRHCRERYCCGSPRHGLANAHTDCRAGLRLERGSGQKRRATNPPCDDVSSAYFREAFVLFSGITTGKLAMPNRETRAYSSAPSCSLPQDTRSTPDTCLSSGKPILELDQPGMRPTRASAANGVKRPTVDISMLRFSSSPL